MKVVEFKTLDGTYQIPLTKIAENRADYYSKQDGFDKNSEEYEAEIHFILNDKFEGIDWLINNTDFEDWNIISKKVSDEDINCRDFWSDSDNFEIKNI
jgi:hypothetical protein